MKDYITNEQAKALRNLGFPHKDFLINKKECDCSVLFLVQKWLREAKGIYIDVQTTWLGSCGYAFNYLITKEDKEVFEENHPCFTYEDALSLGIDVALKLDFDNIPEGYIVIKTPID